MTTGLFQLILTDTFNSLHTRAYCKQYYTLNILSVFRVSSRLCCRSEVCFRHVSWVILRLIFGNRSLLLKTYIIRSTPLRRITTHGCVVENFNRRNIISRFSRNSVANTSEFLGNFEERHCNNNHSSTKVFKMFHIFHLYLFNL